MKTLELSFTKSTSNYQILIGKGLLNDSEAFLSVINGEQIAIVSNETIAPHYLSFLQETLKAKKVSCFVIQDGESFKNRDSYHQLLDFLIENKFKRNDTLVALGGGVIGDLTGFAASGYFRGINFIQVPTSLLAQVDSSIGGKTAINHPSGKNLIGAFHQPVRVITDTDTLKTLPQREFRSGIAEIIKVAMICDVEFFDWLKKTSVAICQQEPDVLTQMIEWACRLKAQIVSLDETEQGVRASLNLGHTFGHAIEHYLGYGALLHGEAVAIGIYWASLFAKKQALMSSHDVIKVKSLLEAFDLPTSLPSKQLETQENIKQAASQLALAMELDKKNHNQNIKLVLPNKIGQVVFNSDFNSEAIESFLLKVLGENNE